MRTLYPAFLAPMTEDRELEPHRSSAIFAGSINSKYGKGVWEIVAREKDATILVRVPTVLLRTCTDPGAFPDNRSGNDVPALVLALLCRLCYVEYEWQWLPNRRSRPWLKCSSTLVASENT
jgi:hypothetical protein